MHPAVAAGGYGLHQPAVHLPDFKGDAAQPLGLVRRVHLDNLGTADGRVINRDILGVLSVYLHCLVLGGRIDHIAVQRLSFGNDDGAHDSGQADLAVGVSGVEALAGQVAVVCVHVGAVRVRQEELHPAEGFFRDRIQLFDHKAALLLVVEAERLHLAGLDLDGLRRGVQHEPFHRLDLLRGDGGAGLQALQHDAAIFIGDELAVGIADDSTAGIGD